MFSNRENVLMQPRHHGTKTPAVGRLNPKTPFKIPLNDENAAGTVHPKTGNKLFGGRDASQFVTPIGPRRTALAGKTTNAKARQLAPSGGKGKGVELEIQPSGSGPECAVKPKSLLEDDDYVPEIEYCPPTPIDLPYIPDDIDFDFAADLSNGKYMNNCHRAFLSDLDSSGRTKTQRDMAANFQRAEAELDAETLEILNEMKGIPAPPTRIPVKNMIPSTRPTRPAAAPTRSVSGSVRSGSSASARPSSRTATSRPSSRAATTSSSRPSSRSATSRPPSRGPSARPSSRGPSARPASRGPSTADSRHAANLLSRPSRALASFAQPTASSHSRSRSSSNLASRSTIGYTSGREIQKKIYPQSVVLKKRETAQEVVERIQKHDEDVYSGLDDWALAVHEQDDEIVDLTDEMQRELGLAGVMEDQASEFLFEF